MSLCQIYFKINEKEKITVQLEHTLNEIDCCDNGILILKLNNNKNILFNDAFYYGIQKLSVMLQKSLQYKLLIHASITKDIGYLYNEAMHGKSNLFYTQLEGRKFWIGRMYHLWTYEYTTTWMYNDYNQNIIFEVTPAYPKTFFSSKNATKIISYEQWMQSYKPYLIRTIPKATAEEWLNQANYIVEQIDKNIAKWKT